MTKKPERLIKYITLEHDICLEYASLQETIVVLNEMIKTHTGFDRLYLDKDVEYGYYPGDSDRTTFNLVGERKETDAEYDTRIAAYKEAEKKQKLQRDAQDVKEYERLSKKFSKDQSKLQKLKKKLEKEGKL